MDPPNKPTRITIADKIHAVAQLKPIIALPFPEPRVPRGAEPVQFHSVHGFPFTPTDNPSDSVCRMLRPHAALMRLGINTLLVLASSRMTLGIGGLVHTRRFAVPRRALPPVSSATTDGFSAQEKDVKIRELL